MPEEAQEPGDLPEPTHSETRPRQPGEALGERSTRASVRPSAFGLPRSPYASVAPGPLPEVSSAAANDAARAPRSEPETRPAPTHTRADLPRIPSPAQARVSTTAPTFEEDETETRSSLRLQNERSRVVDQLTAEPARATAASAASLPSAPPSAAPAPSTPPPSSSTAPHARSRRPWGSIALFSGMLLLSVVPLLRYARSHESPKLEPAPAALPASQTLTPIVTSTVSGAGANELAARTQAQAAAEREQQLAGLVAAGNRALESDAMPEAERLFGRVVELDEDNPRAAFGLARIRLSQGNLSGAEGWIQLALRKRPKRRAYHALYAEILTRLGRHDEARDEQLHAELKDVDDER